jgi:hypothetical protein
MHSKLINSTLCGAAAPLLIGLSVTSGCDHVDAAVPDTGRTLGDPVALGEGTARAYVIMEGGAPTELGIALSESALEGLPSDGSGHHGDGMMTHEYILELPAGHGTPFTFIELNWNPSGHEPDGVYAGVPHFDFHFYTVSRAERDAIDPADPQFAEKANNLPDIDFIPAYNLMLAPPEATPAEVAVPRMGVHWVDTRSPELQGMFGNPDGFGPFTTTFIHGTWDGQVHFWEPMITRAYILEKKTTQDPAVRDEVIELPKPARYQAPGYYPEAYRIQWDAATREYRIALTRLKVRN